ncbi:MAG: molybdopterin-dependent oxidoreductase [Pseudomonadales bacterium]|nr:molybdopterin-dependent oxidoreductase [Pseudomonadales bacterium]
MSLKDTNYSVKYRRVNFSNAPFKSKVFYGACPQDCPDGCAMLFNVEEGRLTKVSGNPDHPFTRGRLCVKLKDFADHHYHPERLHYPLRRSGVKGQGKFVRISWDEALDEIKERWGKLILEHGAQTILPYGFAGNMGILNGMNAGDAFFNKLGSSIGEKTFCASSTITAQFMTIGPTLGTDPELFVYAKFILIWGANTITTNSHLWPFIASAQKNGAKVVVIDPYRSRTAKEADWHIAPKPGTDVVLALAMINLIIENSWLDQDYIKQYTLGFDELKDAASPYSAEEAERITGVKAEDIKLLTCEYAKTQPAVIRVGVGLERYPNGGQAVRAIDCLPALTGAWRHVGGGLLQMPVFFPVRFDLLSRPEWIRDDTRVINLANLADVLVDDSMAPPVHSLFVWNANPVSQLPDSNKVVAGLMREDLFTIVSEHFLTDTARYADLILPATMAAEHNDIFTSWGHFYITLNEQAIDPPGEAISNFELFQQLAARFSFEDSCFTKTDKETLADALDWDTPLLKGKSFHMLQKEGFIHVNALGKNLDTPHAEGNFPTPSGKCEFKCSLDTSAGFVVPPVRQMLAQRQNSLPIDSIPVYKPDCIDDEYPGETPSLKMISPKSHAFLNSEYANEEHKLKKQGTQFVLINPEDADSQKIKHGDVVRIFNKLGELTADVQVTCDVPKGVVVATFGYWRSRSIGNGAVNALTRSNKSSFAGTPYYNDAWVKIEKIP